MADFQIANGKTKLIEGELADSPSDRGGLTYRGIASNFWPNWPGWGTIRTVLEKTKHDIPAANKLLRSDQKLQALVDAFYKQNFWDVFKLDLVTDQDIANEIYDTAVNMGVAIAAKFLQRALNLANRNQKLYPDLAVDGIIGTKTISALNSNPNKKLILKLLNGLQIARYISIMENNPTQEIYAESWLSRT
ncbi:hypothetical protein MUY27_02960 [Mucilaginibacter sp. RS28]|uniref:Peptidoglycan binding protein n=1 Tax=Mucilaginibacter straminoryzae TaxID=2932774 RepID=A0A9X2B7S2_9SPHI|nr:glycosyl hydrolase 108 family protein [Mucilaginibacter straminoryzae]MCJ8208651.1 hypothetical protein [Mucilaginibacter straminoryzae]